MEDNQNADRMPGDKLGALVELTAKAVNLIDDMHQNFSKKQLKGLLAFSAWTEMLTLLEYERTRYPVEALEMHKILLEAFQEQIEAAS